MGPKKDPFHRETRSGRVPEPSPQGAVPKKNPFQRQVGKGELKTSEPSLPHPQGDAHPHSAALKSHDSSRHKCCLVCMRYTKISMNDAMKNGIHSLFGIQFDYSDRKVPLGICATCQRGIYDYKRTGVNSRKLELTYKNFDVIKITQQLGLNRSALARFA